MSEQKPCGLPCSARIAALRRILVLSASVRLSVLTPAQRNWRKKARVAASIACPEPMGLDRCGKTLKIIHQLRSPRKLRAGLTLSTRARKGWAKWAPREGVRGGVCLHGMSSVHPLNLTPSTQHVLQAMLQFRYPSAMTLTAGLIISGGGPVVGFGVHTHCLETISII